MVICSTVGFRVIGAGEVRMRSGEDDNRLAPYVDRGRKEGRMDSRWLGGVSRRSNVLDSRTFVSKERHNFGGELEIGTKSRVPSVSLDMIDSLFIGMRSFGDNRPPSESVPTRSNRATPRE